MGRKTGLVLLMLSLLLSSFFGCKSPGDLLGKNKEQKVTYETSSEISIPMEKIRTLNPVILRDEEAYYLDRLIYQGLFTLNEDLSAKGELAESWEYEDNGAAVVISLKKGVRFHDGSAFSAEDVKYSVDAYLSVYDPAAKSVYDAYTSLIQSAEVLDDGDIRIRFKNPKNAAIENLTFPILPKGTAKKAAAVRELKDGFKPVGTGPYMVDSIEGSKLVTLVGNPYFQGAVPQNTLMVKYIPDKTEAVNLFDIRQYNMTFLKEGDREALLSGVDAKVYSFSSNEVELIGFNFRNPALKNKKVRQAIAYALDPKEIIDSCYYGNGVVNDTIYYPGYLGIESEKSANPIDTETAEALLVESGVEEFSFGLLVNADNPERLLAAKVIQKSLQNVGITINLVAVGTEEYKAKLSAGSFDLYLGGYRIKDTYDLRPLLRTYANPIGYSNILLDSLLDRMQSGISPEEKKKTFMGIRKVLKQDLPYYCLLYKTYGVVASKDVQGDARSTFFDVYKGCEQWTLKYEIVEPQEEQ